jgi:hypothetical protein
LRGQSKDFLNAFLVCEEVGVEVLMKTLVLDESLCHDGRVANGHVGMDEQLLWFGDGDGRDLWGFDEREDLLFQGVVGLTRVREVLQVPHSELSSKLVAMDLVSWRMGGMI